MIGAQIAHKILETPFRMQVIKCFIPYPMAARYCSGGSAAGEPCLWLPTSGLNRVSLKETNGKKWDLLDPLNSPYIDPEMAQESIVNRIVNRLKAKDLQRNILELRGVRGVYFQIKTFKSFQVFLNLSSSKITE